MTAAKKRYDLEEARKAVAAIFDPGQVVEVRMMDKKKRLTVAGWFDDHDLLAKAVCKLTRDGFGDPDSRRFVQGSIYWTLNPVHDALLSRQAKNKLAFVETTTSDSDILRRRWLPIDIDPKRPAEVSASRKEKDDALATLNDLYDKLTQQCGVPESSLLAASSGNGFHMLLRIDLPNDKDALALVKDCLAGMQELAGTELVDIDQKNCNAARIFKAYGTLACKGVDTEDRPWRMARMLGTIPAEITVCANDVLEKIASFAAKKSKRTKATGKQQPQAGPWTEELLEEYLEWTGWEHGPAEPFKKGLKWVGVCPNNSEHKDAALMFDGDDVGWWTFTCFHNSCSDVNAEMFRAHWEAENDEAYDYPRRKPAALLDPNVDDLTGAEGSEEPIDEDEIPGYVTKPKRKAAVASADNTQVQSAVPAQAPETASTTVLNAVQAAQLLSPKPRSEEKQEQLRQWLGGSKKKPAPEFPDECLYGWLGQKARELNVPLGYAYPSMLAAFAPQVKFGTKSIRPTVYVALVGPVHSGKSQAMSRALNTIIYSDGDAVKKTVPGSDRGLVNIFGGKRKKDNDTTLEPAKPRLLLQDELRNTFSKISIQGSSLAATLCSLFYEDEAGSADKTGEHVCLVRLNILGGLKAADPEEFGESFGRETSAGLYDRFIYGLHDTEWDYEDWEPQPELRCAKAVTFVSPTCWKLLDTWKAEGRALDRDRSRLGEIVMRVALITAAANHEDEITVECMKAALLFGDWQDAIRVQNQPSEADGADSKCTEAVINALQKVGNKWLRWTRLCQNKNWYKKFGASTLNRTKDALAKGGVIEEERVDPDNPRSERTGKIRFLLKV